MSEHAWTQENLDAFVTGAMSADEAGRIERHLETCPECAEAKAQIARMETLLQGACARVRPEVGLEDRAIQRLRKAPRRKPQWLRFTLAAAAVVVLGIVGLAVQGLALEGVLPLPGMAREAASSALGLDFVGGTWSGVEDRMKRWSGQVRSGSQRMQQPANGKVGGIVKAEHAAEQYHLFVPSGDVKIGDKSYALNSNSLYDGAKNLAKPDPAAKFFVDSVAALGGEQKKEKDKTFFDLTDEMSKDAGKATKDIAMRIQAENERTARRENLDLAKGDKGGKGPAPGQPPGGGMGLISNGGGFGGGMMGMAGGGGGGAAPSAQPGYHNAFTTNNPYYNLPNGTLASASTYLPILPPPVTVTTAKPVTGKPGEKAPTTTPLPTEAPAQDKKPAPAKTDPEKQPDIKPVGRMIIRTGEMEFETDSFDSAVEAIAKLIGGVPGGFIATVNSDKLPNGKTKGSVVVRMPPTGLDKFIFDLRRELAKSSELKNQRLGSLDVSKQYTDIESRLRAARAIEDRLINIIKTGRGEIKDLVAAEKELAIWRTKIEEMEGELRYYSNQVSLSTLTISLAEKELRAPTAIVVTETVTMRIEADEVGKVHQAAMKAVVDLKGRITRSDLKQHTAGQFISNISADIPPAKKDAFIAELKKLGIVSDFQENQRQTMEGGSGKAPELKPKTSDVHFDITIHNTANIRPRLSADLKLATSDVPGAYAKLLDLVAKVKGQVRDGKLNEQDYRNIHATLDFNVPTTDKPALDKLLAEIGVVLQRVNVRAPINEVSTERKFGYTLLLRDIAWIPAKKGLVEILAVNDVPGSYQKLQDAIAKVKGQVAFAKLDEQNKLAITAQLDFAVPSDEKSNFEKLFTELGTMLSRSNVSAAENLLATDKKFGFVIILRDIVNILPSHASDIKVAAADVPGSYAKLVEAVTKAKGQIRTAKLNEQDKLNITAQLDFTVPIADKPALDKLLGEIGTLLSRNNVQAPVTELTTPTKFGYAVVLRDIATIPPRETFLVSLACGDVPAAFRDLKDTVAAAAGLVTTAQLNEESKTKIEAKFDFTLSSADRQQIETLFGKVGAVLVRTSSQMPVNDLASDKKVGYRLVLRSVAEIPPREVIAVKQEVKDVEGRMAEISEIVTGAKGRVIEPNVDRENGQVVGTLKLEVPYASRDSLLKQIKGNRSFVSQKMVPNPTVPENELTTAHIIVTLVDSPLVPSDQSLGSYVQSSLAMSFRMFSVCVMLIILGVSAVLPWVLVIWIAYKIYVKLSSGGAPTASEPPPSGTAPAA